MNHEARQSANWIAMDDEHTDAPTIYAWGDWTICEICGWFLIVSSGVEYGPFGTKEAAMQHAENVRGD